MGTTDMRKLFNHTFFLLVMLVLVPVPAMAESIDTMAGHFFELPKQGQTDQAMDALTAGNKWLSRDADGVASLRGNLKRSGELFGKYQFHELLSETRVGQHYVHRIYLLGYERQPLTCKLSFYNPDGHWQVQNIAFGLDLVEDVARQADAKLIQQP